MQMIDRGLGDGDRNPWRIPPVFYGIAAGLSASEEPMQRLRPALAAERPSGGREG